MRVGINGRLLFNDKMDGVARYVFETSMQIALDHPKDEFIIFYDRPSTIKHLFPSNVKHVLVYCPTRHPILWKLWLDILLPIYIKKEKIEVFYSGDGFLSLKSKIPTVLVTHDLAYLYFTNHTEKGIQNYYEKYVPRYIQRAAINVTVSEYVKSDIIKHINLPAKNLLVAYNALPLHAPSTSIDTSNPIHINKPYFLYVGAIHPRKNVINLITAFNNFNHSHNEKYELVLVGSMSWKTEEIKDKLKISTSVTHLGYISEKQKNELIINSIAVVYVSLFEGFGIPIIEAFAHGKPVVTSNVTSMPEIAGNNAILVDPNDVNDIANGLEKSLESNQNGISAIYERKKRALEFSWHKSADIIFSAIKDTFTLYSKNN